MSSRRGGGRWRRWQRRRRAWRRPLPGRGGAQRAPQQPRVPRGECGGAAAESRARAGGGGGGRAGAPGVGRGAPPRRAEVRAPRGWGRRRGRTAVGGGGRWCWGRLCRWRRGCTCARGACPRARVQCAVPAVFVCPCRVVALAAVGGEGATTRLPAGRSRPRVGRQGPWLVAFAATVPGRVVGVRPHATALLWRPSPRPAHPGRATRCRRRRPARVGSRLRSRHALFV